MHENKLPNVLFEQMSYCKERDLEKKFFAVHIIYQDTEQSHNFLFKLKKILPLEEMRKLYMIVKRYEYK